MNGVVHVLTKVGYFGMVFSALMTIRSKYQGWLIPIFVFSKFSFNKNNGPPGPLT